MLALTAAAPVLSAQAISDWQTALASWKGVRPRLMIDAKKLANIKSYLNTTYSAIFKRVANQTSIIRGTTIPSYSVMGTTDDQLWQRDVGDSMSYLAFAYLITGDDSYRIDCLKWVQASLNYPTWGTGSRLNSDLAAGHQLFGLSLVYDWLQPILDSATAANIRQTLMTRAPYIYDAAANPKTSWYSTKINSHMVTPVVGLFAAALTLFDDPAASTQALQWIDRCRGRMQETQSLLWPDGASAEGVTYWDYGMQFMMQYFTLSEALLNEPPTGKAFAFAPWYRIYLTVPVNTWFFQNPGQMDIGDCARGQWYGPSPHIHRLGAISQNGHAQWYSDTIVSKGVDRYMNAWLNFVWYDPSLAAIPPAGLPTMRYFDNMGMVSARSDWSGSESMVTFKCGAPCGLTLNGPQYSNDTEDVGHAHPDANHFVLFGNGEFLIRDDGYLDIKKSENHNTLLVGGKGQLGEGQEFFDLTPYLNATTFPSILKTYSSPNLDYFVGEAAPAYSFAQGVRQFTRHLLFLKPNALVVFDDIQLSQSAAMELRFHTEANPVSSGSNVYLSKGANGVLRTELLTPSVATATTGVAVVTDHGTTYSRPSIRFQRTGVAWRNVTAFSWGAQTPQPVTVNPTANGYTVALGSRLIDFNWDRTTPVESTPVPTIRSVQPAFGGNQANGFSSNSYIEIYGDSLATETRPWSGSDFQGSNAPQSLSGTRVLVNGLPAFVYYISPQQVNVNLPQDLTTGVVELQVVTNGVPSNILVINRATAAPAMLTTSAFKVNGKQYVVALLPTSTASGPFVGPAGLIPGVPFQQVRPGDSVTLYVLGAGPTNPATQAGVAAPANSKVSSTYTLRIGGQTATVDFFGVVAGSIGLYQLNARVPNISAGDQPIELTVAGVKDQQNLYLGGIQQ